MITVTVVHRKTRHALKVEASCLLADFRARVQEVTGVAPDHQQLYASGRPRISSSAGTLKDIGVQDGAKVFLVAADPQHASTVAGATDRAPRPSATPDVADALWVVHRNRIWSCSFPLGPVKQHLFRCLTCEHSNQPAAVCLGCMEVCHQGHQVEELYVKRHFQCDCGTERLRPTACRFSTGLRAAQATNQYGPNFSGRYCHCGGRYDADADEMIQCWVCGDWLHDRCTGIPEAELPDDLSEHLFLCRRCVAQHPFLRHYGRCCSAEGPTSILPAPAAEPACPAVVPPAPTPTADADSSGCGAPPAGETEAAEERDLLLPEVGAGWCHCDRCLALYERSGLSFIFKEEQDDDMTRFCVASEDSDSDEEAEAREAQPDELTSRALQMMRGMEPIAQTHFASGVSDLKASLASWLCSLPPGHVVTAATVEQFWAGMRERQKRKREEMG
eukprot:GGOE01061978.1.p1 GENE.GGOE01061978.1~~GGOE01061978.1.p1  ORF type:complete len:453 (-),score=88.06 GGOE01061978.1:385-1722(-)